jgi:hypothetical protein
MKRLSLIGGYVLASSLSPAGIADGKDPQATFRLQSACIAIEDAVAKQQDAIAIPLDQIWTNSSPNTREIEELAKEQIKVSGRDLWRPMVRSLSDPPWRAADGQLAKPGFVVEGSGLEAFREAHAVLVGDKKPQRAVSSGSEFTLVFFSRPVQAGLELQEVTRRGNVIELQYRFVGRAELYLTTHLALIPLGKLAAGQYEVKVVQMPSVQKFNGRYIKNEPEQRVPSAERIVSGSFSFEVTIDSETRSAVEIRQQSFSVA